MDNASDKKPLLPSNSSRASGEGSSKESKFDSKTDTKTESNKETNKDSKKESIKDSKKSKKETPLVSGGGNEAPTRIIRPTVQARPFSTKTKGIYWIFTFLHLVILLSVLFAISYGLLLFVFAQTKERPLYFGQGSFIGGVPAVMYEPIDRDKEAKKGVISFDPNDNSTYKKYVERLTEVMKRNNVSTINDDEQCTKHSSNLIKKCIYKNKERTCKGNMTTLSCYHKHSLPFTDTSFCNEKQMGYRFGKPCLLIRLTKLLGFFPFDKKSKGTNNVDVMDPTCGGIIKFKCTVLKCEKNITIENHPKGIPFCSFPFWKQTNYEAPYIMIRPRETLPTGETKIKCVPDLEDLEKLSNGRENEVTITIDMAKEPTETDSNEKTTNGNTTTTEKPDNYEDKSSIRSEEKVTTPIPTKPPVEEDKKNKDTVTTTEIPITSTVKTE